MQRLNRIKMPTREMPKQSGHHIAHSLQIVILVRQSVFLVRCGPAPCWSNASIVTVSSLLTGV